jgi:hypothetical protein
MAQYRVLKSVAHNIGASFTSLMNYAGDDYVMGHLLTLARQSGQDTLTIDFVTGEARPPELLRPPISEVPVWYTKMFWDLVQRHGSDRSLVQSATLTLRYDISIEQPAKIAPELRESPFACDVQITDRRGKQYSAHFDGWWFPEKVSTPVSKFGGLAKA